MRPPRPSLSRSLAISLLALIVGACVSRDPIIPQPSVPTQRPPTASFGPTSPTVVAGPASVAPGDGSPPPSIPSDVLPRAATTEADGVRVTIELERNPMPAGEPTWIDKTITNTGLDPVIYYPCGDSVSVSGLIPGLPWRPGRDLPEPAKNW
jgi:hypothetical protein